MPSKDGSFEKDGKTYQTITLFNEGERYGFTFGVSKAKLVLANIEDIKAFVNKNEKKE